MGWLYYHYSFFLKAFFTEDYISELGNSQDRIIVKDNQKISRKLSGLAMSYNFIKMKTEKKNKRIKRWFNIAIAYEDTTNFEAVPNISKSVVWYGKVDGKDNSVILGTLWGWTTWSRIKKSKFFDDSITASIFTERKRVIPDEVTNPDKENMKYYVSLKTSLKEMLIKVSVISAIHY